MPRNLRNPAVIAAHVAKVHGCELSPFLACCGGHGATEIHHVLRGPNRIDAPWNIVARIEEVAMDFDSAFQYSARKLLEVYGAP